MRTGGLGLLGLSIVSLGTMGCSATSPPLDAGDERVDVGTRADAGHDAAASGDDAGADTGTRGDAGPDGDAAVDQDAGCARTTCTALGAHCGAPDDGCGTPLDCGACEGVATCVDGACECGADTREPDETLASAFDGGAYTDADADITVTDRWLHTATDVDWIRYAIDDTTTATLATLSATIDAPASGTYEVALFYDCAAGTNASSCAQGTSDTTVGHGCVATTSGPTRASVSLDVDCQGTFDDSGTLYVRVSSTGATPCAPYRLVTQIR